ncbi:hypothetical protein Cgig2_024468 [Carnegiea gigantea]|uniref:RRM domain-containing protein n=1 Tax=Carnegiea gigantea TaxID=171969 RepID=A0A9Q1KMD0_9CARY|nr:hypothetical protein Cgig2_024468 [Carnegiea gigantea]
MIDDRRRTMLNKPKRPGYGGAESETPSTNLWVGNLPTDMTESELTELFEKHGLIDGITCYSSRTYAFVYYKRVEDAVAAKDALQGFVIGGNPIKIEFAKPAKPSKHVWVGGFGSSVTKEKLEEELSKFGNIEDFKFIRDRNIALVDFVRLEDASAAVKSLNGLQIGGYRIRVDFLRSHPGRKEQSDFPEMRGAHFRGTSGFDLTWSNTDAMRNYPDLAYSGHKRPQPSQSFGARKEGPPSKVLWVGYPPSVVIDEEMLHNAMILYGEIERITCFPDRHYSFVEFRSVEEARRAKEALQGRLFNDPRITIMFSSSELAPGKDFGPPYPGFRGQGRDMFTSEVPFRPPLMDMFPVNRAVPPNFHVPPAQNGLLRPGVPRPFGPRGSVDPLLPTPDFNDGGMLSGMSDLSANAPLGMSKRKLSPPGGGLLPSPAVPSRRPYKISGWDVLDPNQLPRESKRSRVDGLASFNDPMENGDESLAAVDQPYGADSQFIGGPLRRVQGDGILGAVEMGVTKGHVPPPADEDFIWRGVIAKGGTPVCHARCIPIGKGLESELPEVVNCSARTGLDMLAKHYVGAIGFDIVFFLPDSEDDFANYTEFLRYLGSKNRAGVAKLDDGTTLFLVPPSDFLTDVLKVSARERLYGVVLKLPQQLPGGASTPQQVHQPAPPIQHMEGQLAPPLLEYVAPNQGHQPLPPIQQIERQVAPITREYAAPKKDLAAQMDYGRADPNDVRLPPKTPIPTGCVSQDSPGGAPSTSKPGVTLTPELIATLASLLPPNIQASVAQSAQPQSSSSAAGLQFLGSTNSQETFSQGWSQQPQVLDQTGQSSQHSGGPLYPNSQPTTTFQSFPPNLNPISHPVAVLPESMPMQNPVYNFQEQASISSRPLSIHPAMQSQQFVPSTQGIQHYTSQGIQPYTSEAPHINQKGHAVAHGTAAGSYGLADTEQPKNPVSYSNQFHAANLSLPDNAFPASTGSINMEPLNQAERLQTVPPGAGQGSEEVEVDKNQRYQSTLQFAANLLMQIQQQQQQQQEASQLHCTLKRSRVEDILGTNLLPTIYSFEQTS